MKLYSTLDRKVVDIKPIKEGSISMYNCGPTVYSRMHVGNIRAYVSWDILHRALLYLGFEVERVMNFTDVGHMTADEDFGEDKMDMQAKKSGKEPIDIANEYIKTVLSDFSELNMLAPSGEVVDVNWDVNDVRSHGWLRATEYVDEMIEDVKKIVDNGFAYETDQAVYFDVTKIDDYTIFTGQDLSDKVVAHRDDVSADPGKRHPADFVLWMKRVGKYENHIMHWDSPWGDGFPGWHIECSAMSVAVLGKKFDIHTGGIDHVSVHHPNERAQNIGVCGQPVVNYWIHNEFIVGADDGKLSKSLGNGLTLAEVKELGFSPMDLRYLYISSNYRTKLQFSEHALEGAKNARLGLIKKIKGIYDRAEGDGVLIEEFIHKFSVALEDNLNMSLAFAVVNELLKSDNSPEDILETVYDFDRVLSLDLKEEVESESDDNIPDDVKKVLEERELARINHDWSESDRLRDIISDLGYTVLDTSDGQILEKK